MSKHDYPFFLSVTMWALVLGPGGCPVRTDIRPIQWAIEAELLALRSPKANNLMLDIMSYCEEADAGVPGLVFKTSRLSFLGQMRVNAIRSQMRKRKSRLSQPHSL